MNCRATRSVAVALVAVALVFTWQALTVHFNYGGNWTALFCTGERLRVPPQLAGEGIYLFRASLGYDGQFYHYMAHDPFLKRGFAEYMDDARLRYRRLLVPAAAYILAAGQDRCVDTAMFFAGMKDPFGYARLASPLLLLVAVESMGGGWRFGWAPLVLVTLRTAAQLTPQALSLLRGLLGK